MSTVSILRVAALAAACQSLVLQDATAADEALIQAAKKEGSVTWYTTLIVNQMARPAVDAFQKKYGIKVNYVRADTNVSIVRIQNEAQAGKTQADVIDTTSGTPLLKRMGLLEKWLPDGAKALPAEYVDPEGYWVAASLYTLTFGYNTNLVPKGSEPKSFKDLLDPRWKGKIAVSGNASSPGVAGLVGFVLANMGERQGIEYLKLLAVQRPSVIQASTRQVLDMVIASEYSLGLQILNHHVAFSANRGAPVGWVKLDPAMAAFLALAVIKGPHPNAGKLLVDFLLSDEGQAIFRDADYVPVAPNVPPQDPSLRPDGKSFRALYFTPEKLDENISRWMSIYSEILR